MVIQKGAYYEHVTIKNKKITNKMDHHRLSSMNIHATRLDNTYLISRFNLVVTTERVTQMNQHFIHFANIHWL